VFIHLIEDDPILAKTLVINLELEKHRVLTSSSLQDAIAQYSKNQFDAVILDLGLPDGSGFDFLQLVRKENKTLPILILSAQSDEDSVVKGLVSGANDFVKKPYSFKELNARLNLIAHKVKAAINEKIFEYKNLKIDKDKRAVFFLEKEIELNRREFDILAYFVQNSERIITREMLLQHLDKDLEIFDRTIDSHISHIRKTFKKNDISDLVISSVYGLGYRFEEKNGK